MQENDRWKLIRDLDEELLKGGVILSEWCCFLVREADTTFANGAYLATVITAMAAIETYLRSEYGHAPRVTLHNLIEQSVLSYELKADLHDLRRCRNKWVHVSDPWDDQTLIDQPALHEQELMRNATIAIRALRRTIYSAQWV
jgi:hypothetical protein